MTGEYDEPALYHICFRTSITPARSRARQTDITATAQAMDPPVGVCQVTVTCTYAHGGKSCDYPVDIPVRKPYRLVEATSGPYATKHIT
jgi:hypothetical protein